MLMNDTPTIDFKDVNSEDLSDILIKVEKSFDFKFAKAELKDVTTFGELCDIIISKVQGDNTDDCTTQQAFYKLRNAFSTAIPIDKDKITTETVLLELFPKQ